MSKRGLLKKVRVLYFGYQSLGTACLRSLIEHPQVDLVGVFTHAKDVNENVWFETPHSVARSVHLPIYEDTNLKSKSVLLNVQSLAPDLLLSVYYRHMIPKEILEVPRLGAFNLHGSLLPKYRGRCPVNWVLINGETETGVTLHGMTPKPDDGDVIDQIAISVSKLDTARSLFDKVNAQGLIIFNKNLNSLLSGKTRHQEQNHRQATYFGGRKPEDGKINWHLNANSIYNLIRGVTFPYPGAFSEYRVGPHTKKVTIWWGYPMDTSPLRNGAPGQIFLNRDSVMVQCGENTALRLIEMEENEPSIPAPYKNMVDVAQWYRRLICDNAAPLFLTNDSSSEFGRYRNAIASGARQTDARNKPLPV